MRTYTNTKKKIKGFTLVEILLVLVVVSMIIYMVLGYIQQRTLAMRIDRTTAQMQQILNAGLSFYVANGTWPTQISDLQPNFLPSGTLVNAWGQNYFIAPSTDTPPALLFVYTAITGTGSGTGSATAPANIIAGRLPLSYTTSTLAGTPPPAGVACAPASTVCNVVASVNIPGQNLNNASAVNYAGLYRNGACVPVPTCPVDANGNTMTPQIIAIPTAVAGTSTPSSTNTFPINAFNAYATGPANAVPGPPKCTTNPGSSTSCYSDVQGGTLITTGRFWRVCVAVTTERGLIRWGSDASSNNWGQNAQIAVITRCSITNEPTGSGFNVFTP